MQQERAATGQDLNKPAVEQRQSRYRYVIAGLMLALNFGFGLSFFAASPVLPLVMDDYDASRATASLLTSLVILVVAAVQFPGSMLVGRLPLKKQIAIGWLLGSANVFTFLAGSFPAVLGLRLSYAIGYALVFPAIGPLLMQWFRPKELALVNSLNIAVLSAGISIATFSAAPLAGAFGWKAALSLFGGASLIGALVWVALGRTQENAGTAQRLPLFGELVAALRSRTVLVLAAADAGAYGQYAALTTWLPTFYYEAHGMSLERAGALTGILPFMGMGTVLLAGLLSLRFPRRKPYFIVAGVCTGLGGFGAFLLAGTPMMYAALIAVGFGAWFYIPAFITIPMELPGVTPRRVAAMGAILGGFGSTLAFIAPLAVGALTDLTGTYVLGFVLFAALSWSLLAGGVLLPETGAAGATKKA
ncbi:MAG: MFS transporter [Chloroflexi bacterium]|nr:MFS transporter [Chloroflexota bacterium]